MENKRQKLDRNNWMKLQEFCFETRKEGKNQKDKEEMRERKLKGKILGRRWKG
jgi:hypothetical protein